MRKFVYTVFALGIIAVAQPASAQVNVQINIGSQPAWGPVGYDYVRYYYLPEMDIYYDVVGRRYTYPHGRRWVTTRTLPRRYRHVDMHRTYKVVLNNSQPWRNHHNIRKQYGHYAHNHSQRVLRDHRGHEKHLRKKPAKHRAHPHKRHRH
ncbi:hypothetical protein [Sphingobacterium griseoflavum]|uniref:Uncharacterized protein n=1 Tax=Sphingobacterium griseoflavum TaxID=1474952 RepID=A0ABQ3HX35_9SPHI|nr:hypothetical protein [Sphingobacterium griseoflavum]GHE34749.1 hypothetical protein GCM10017764_17400 [Sphingobacterium griseoflavum]